MIKISIHFIVEKIPSFEFGTKTVLIKFNTTIKGTGYCISHFNKKLLN
jgi:hypothetical protein